MMQAAEVLGAHNPADVHFVESDSPPLNDPVQFLRWYYGDDWYGYSPILFSIQENERRALYITQEEADRSDFTTRVQLFSNKRNCYFHVALHDPQAIASEWKRDNP